MIDDHVSIPDDIFIYLITFLEPVDCMSFVLSAVSERFTTFYTRRSNWTLSQNYSLRPEICQQFFSSDVVSWTVMSIDVSQCYWFPEDILVSFLSKLENLTELKATGTKMTLSHLPTVLEKCQNIKKLEIDISQNSWKSFVSATESCSSEGCSDVWSVFKSSFEKLTALKISVTDGGSPDTWMLLFKILGWCRDCVDLHLDIFYSDGVATSCYWELKEWCNRIMEEGRSKFYPDLQWMTSLKKISLTRTGCLTFTDRCCNAFIRWLLLELKPLSLEHIWLPSVKDVTIVPQVSTPLIRAHLGHSVDTHQECEPHSNRFVNDKLTHLAGVNLASIGHSPQLLFVHGYCSSFADLERFCQSHGQQVEHLRFETRECCRVEPLRFQCHWALPRLKTLVYANHNPHPDVLTKVTECCPKLEELSIGFRMTSRIFSSSHDPDMSAYSSISNLKQLKKLSLSGVEFTRGDFLKPILENCTRLESLHISGQFEDEVTFHRDLCTYLPLAKSLKDREEITDNNLLDLLTAVEQCEQLERIVILQDEWSGRSDSMKTILPERLLTLAQRLKRLVCLCLAFNIDCSVFDASSALMKRFITPQRPAFWFHLADTPPSRSGSVPSSHLDEIIDPIESFHSL